MKSATLRSSTSDVVASNKACLKSIFIFDDVVYDKQSAMRAYFSMGRHTNIDCFYLCQTYERYLNI